MNVHWTIMTTARTPKPPLSLPLPPRTRGTSAHLWLYAALRDAILAGILRPGKRLPATRDLAAQLSVARGTVVRAFQQLAAEGYTIGTIGAGTFVNDRLPDALLTVPSRDAPVARNTTARTTRRAVTAPPPRRLSRYAANAREFPAIAHRPMRAFRANVPAIELFPTHLWARLAGRRWRAANVRELTGTASLGFPPLQDTIADYLRTSRGVRCEPSQICIVSGVQEALDIAARLTIDPGDRACVEDPGYIGARLVLEAAGARVDNVGVDDEGMRVPTGRAATARIAYVTSSHQYPLGMPMSLARRLTLLEWARANDAMIFEDDYDSEYRYTGHPLPALQGLDTNGRVLFAGSFSKVLFPSLRLGYLVVPRDLRDVVGTIKSITHRHAPVLEQATLADFMTEGHFGRHVRHMREVYAERLGVLRAGAQEYWGERLVVPDIDAGLQTVGWLDERFAATKVVQAAAARDVELVELSRLTQRPLTPDGVQLGFAAVDVRELRRGIDAIAAVLDSLTRPRAR